MGRAQDEAIIAAINGTAYTGVDGSTSVALPSTCKIAHGSAGLTIAKLRTAKKMLDEANVDPMEPRFIAVTAEQVEDLLSTTEVTSIDYNTVHSLVQGSIDTFMGFKFIQTELLADDGTSRLCPVWARSGVLLSVGAEPNSSIDKRTDKTWQPRCTLGWPLVRRGWKK